MPDTPSVILVKSFVYRDLPEEWSNRYHFSGFTPNSDADWLATVNAFVNAEKPILNAATTIVRAYGYNAGSDHANYVHDYTVPGPPPQGTLAIPVGEHALAGDQACCVRFTTGQHNSRGKMIYCWKYLHGGIQNGADPDELLPSYITLVQTYANLLIGGTMASSLRYCGPQGANLTTPLVHKYVTTRTLKRRGKRPLPSA